MGFPGGSAGRNLPVNAGDMGSIPRLGWSPGKGNGNPLQFSCLGSPMDRGAWQATVHEVSGVGHNLATKPPSPYICEHVCVLSHFIVSDSVWPYGLYSPSGSSVHGILQARKWRWAACTLLQMIFPTQGWNSHLLHCRQILYCWAIREVHACTHMCTCACSHTHTFFILYAVMGIRHPDMSEKRLILYPCI